MKKASMSKGKLTLHKETLRAISLAHIAEAHGGTQSTMEKTCGHSCVILDPPRVE